jgi:arylsulfatase A-like enzyme
VARGARLAPLSVLDITPILLHALGVPVPGDLEGQARPEVFDPAWMQAHPVTVGEPTELPEMFPAPASEREGDEQVLARLKSLGYVE